MAAIPGEDPPLIATPEALDDLVAHIRASGRFAFRHRIRLRGDLRADPLPRPGRHRLASGRRRPAQGRRPVGLLGRRDRPLDRGRHARGGRGPADLQAQDRHRARPRLRRPDRRRPGRLRLPPLARQSGPPGPPDLAARRRDPDRLAAQAPDRGPAPLRPRRRPSSPGPGRRPRRQAREPRAGRLGRGGILRVPPGDRPALR